MISWKSLDKADRRVILLFGALSLWTPCGLALAAVSLVNGVHREWPPDDWREAVGFWSSVAIFLTLFVVTLWFAGIQATRTRPRRSGSGAPFVNEPVDPGDLR